jgi:hypothetical protein
MMKMCLGRWTRTKAAIYGGIMAKDWNEMKQSFVPYYGSDAVDEG